VVYTEWIFFGLVAIGLMLLRRRREVTRQYAWGYPVLPAIFVVSSFAVVINTLISNPKDSTIGLSLVLAGIPVYWLWTKRQPRVQSPESRGQALTGS